MSGEPKTKEEKEAWEYLSDLSAGRVAPTRASAPAPAYLLTTDHPKQGLVDKLVQEQDPEWFVLRCGDILGGLAWRKKINGTFKGLTLLHFAAGSGNVELVKFLLANGADPKKADKEGNLPAPDTGDESHEAKEIRALLEPLQKGGRRKKTRSRKSRRRRTLRRKQ